MAKGGALLGVAAAAVLLAALWVWFDSAPKAVLLALSPQQCNTECQRRQTDCILACDGNVPCEQRCTEAGKACVQRCLAASDAGAGGSGGSGGSAGRRNR